MIQVHKNVFIIWIIDKIKIICLLYLNGLYSVHFRHNIYYAKLHINYKV